MRLRSALRQIIHGENVGQRRIRLDVMGAGQDVAAIPAQHADTFGHFGPHVCHRAPRQRLDDVDPTVKAEPVAELVFQPLGSMPAASA